MSYQMLSLLFNAGIRYTWLLIPGLQPYFELLSRVDNIPYLFFPFPGRGRGGGPCQLLLGLLLLKGGPSLIGAFLDSGFACD